MDEAERLQVATDWFMRLRADASGQEIQDWVQWCERSRDNREAFERVQELWSLSLWLAPEVQAGAFDDEEAIVASKPDVARSPRAASHVRHGRRGRRWRRFGIAASALLVCLLAAGGARWMLAGVGNGEIIAAEEPVKHLRLQDGSQMDLATRSVVRVDYSKEVRALDLKGGEAYFHVVPDPQRPFVVQAGPLRIRAVGTAFNVRNAAGRVVVTVTEGTVDVYESGSLPSPKGDAPAPSAPVRIEAGKQLRWERRATAPQLARAEPAMALAWRQGRLEYNDEPLAAVITDLNRYTREPVIVQGEDMRNLRFSGTILVHAADQWVNGLPDIFPARVLRENGVSIVQSSALPVDAARD